MNNASIQVNGVNEAVLDSDCLSPGTDSVHTQADPGRYSTTACQARRKWSGPSDVTQRSSNQRLDIKLHVHVVARMNYCILQLRDRKSNCNL